MILLVNVLLTEERINKRPYDRGLLRPSNRLEIFKYSMHSLSVINFSKVLIYCKLDEEFKDQENDLRVFLNKIYNNLHLEFRRNEYQKDWQKTLDEHIFPAHDNNVFFLCNDDHIFIDSSTETFDQIDKILDNSNSHFRAFNTSHWPEMLYVANHDYSYQRKNNFLSFCPFHCIDSILIVNKETLRHWWFSGNYGDTLLPRTDYFGKSVNSAPLEIYIPLKEQLRHFDGYSHVDIFSECPPLQIPTKEFPLIICPEKKTSWEIGEKGADLKCYEDDKHTDIPLFINKYGYHVNREESSNNKDERNNSILNSATALASVRNRKLRPELIEIIKEVNFI